MGTKSDVGVDLHPASDNVVEHRRERGALGVNVRRRKADEVEVLRAEGDAEMLQRLLRDVAEALDPASGGDGASNLGEAPAGDSLFSNTLLVRHGPYPTGPYPQIIDAMNARTAPSGSVASAASTVASSREIGFGTLASHSANSGKRVLPRSTIPASRRLRAAIFLLPRLERASQRGWYVERALQSHRHNRRAGRPPPTTEGARQDVPNVATERVLFVCHL